MKIKQIKARIKARHFMEGTKVTQAYTVEILNGRKYLPLGEDGRISKFPNEEAARAKMTELKLTEVKQK